MSKNYFVAGSLNFNLIITYSYIDQSVFILQAYITCSAPQFKRSNSKFELFNEKKITRPQARSLSTQNEACMHCALVSSCAHQRSAIAGTCNYKEVVHYCILLCSTTQFYQHACIRSHTSNTRRSIITSRFF